MSICDSRFARVAVVAASLGAIAFSGSRLSGQAAPPRPAPTAPAAAPAAAPGAVAPGTPKQQLPPGWQEIDQRLVFFTVQLSTVESSIDATDKALKTSGYQKIAQEQAAEEARRRNNAMDRIGGGPVRWQEFYGRTAQKFYYHPTDGLTIHVNPDTTLQRPPQFDYIYRANEANRQKAEADAARIGTKIEDLLAYRAQLEAEQSGLWMKIAFRGASSRSIAERPLYRFDLAGPAGDAGKQQTEAVTAAAAFLKAVDAELTTAQKGMDDQKATLDHLLSTTTAARAEMQAKLLKLPTMAAVLADPRQPFAQFVAAAKRLEDSAQNLADAYKLSADAAAKDDLSAKRRYRGQIQEMAIDYASSVATADAALTYAATAWKVVPKAGGEVAVAKPPANPEDLAAKLDAAKATHAAELTGAKRALAAAIDARLNAAADAGDLPTVQIMQSAKIKAATDGSVDETIKDEAVLAAKRTMDQTVAASRTKLANAYRDTIVGLTKARKIPEAIAVQDEFKASGLETAVAASGTPASPGAAPVNPAVPPAPGVGAAVPAGALVQPQFQGETLTVKLAGPADDVVPGGGGRYLIFHIKKLRQLAVFDVSTAKVVKYINAPSDDICYTASRDMLVICVRETGAFQRWNLKTMTQDTTARGIGPLVKTIAMGYDSPGPMIVVLEKTSYLVNPDAPNRGDGLQWDGKYDGAPGTVRMSADGHSATAYNFGGWAGCHYIVLNGMRVVNRTSGGYIHYNDMLLPPDGGRIYDTMEGGKIFSPDWKSMTPFEALPGPGYPSYDSTYFVAWKGPGSGRKKNSTDKTKLVICNVSDRQPVVTLTDLPELEGSAPVKYYQRVHFIPKANILATVGEGGDEVVLRKLDIYKSLEEQGVTYLVVTSAPPFTVVRGQMLNYQITVKSLKGNVKFILDAGPPGMTLSPQGLLRWMPPNKQSVETESVIVKITDDSKQEIFHNFKLTLADAPGATPVTPPKKGR